jgi:hypothetical protein
VPKRLIPVALAAAATVAVVPAAHATQKFQSLPDIAPPGVKVTTKATKTAPGLMFVAPKQGTVRRGPMIYDETGKLVYFRQVPTDTTVLDFRAQRYKGKPVITWWQGEAKRGYGFGKAMIFDQSYSKVAEVKAGNGERMDFHEFTLTSKGTALFIVYKIVRQDLSSVAGGSRNDLAMRNLVQEVDVDTGKVLFEWNANEHIAPTESYDVTPDRANLPYDYIHMNSINLDTDGNLLLSARATNAIYKVSRKTGKIMWRLGGKRSTFAMGKGARFRFQHDAIRQDDGTLTLFDNQMDLPIKSRNSRGLQLRLDMKKKTATKVRQWHNTRRQLSASQGNMQVLPNDDVFIGWGGDTPWMTEFSRSGAKRWEAKFTDKSVDTYRAYRQVWSGQPKAAPRAVARNSGGTITSWVTWNGATTVAAWRVMGGASEAALTPRATVPRSGFETKLAYAGTDTVVVLEALDAEGNVLGRSKAVAVG